SVNTTKDQQALNEELAFNDGLASKSTEQETEENVETNEDEATHTEQDTTTNELKTPVGDVADLDNSENGQVAPTEEQITDPSVEEAGDEQAVVPVKETITASQVVLTGYDRY